MGRRSICNATACSRSLQTEETSLSSRAALKRFCIWMLLTVSYHRKCVSEAAQGTKGRSHRASRAACACPSMPFDIRHSTFRPSAATVAVMNFLVTGGAGFIGSHVCERLLAAGHAVWAFDDLNNFYDPAIKQRNLRTLESLGKKFSFVHGDLTNRAALDALFGGVKFDQVLHLAARAGVRPSLEEPALYQRVNVEGTVHLLEAARARGVKKITMA